MVGIVSDFMDSLTTMTIGCCDKGKPWTAPVYYVRTQLELIFFSAPNSRHSRVFAENSSASAAIHDKYERWQDIKGLQMEGNVRHLSKIAEKSIALRAYLRKFPFAKDFITEPWTISKVIGNISNVQLYVFSPDRILFLDNRRRFGRRWELKVENGLGVELFDSVSDDRRN